MLGDFFDLRETFFAARLLREHLLAAPLRPDARDRVAGQILRANAALPLTPALVRAAVAEGRSPGAGRIDADLVRRIARVAGSDALRTGPGVPFHGRAAPPAARVGALLDEMLETVNSPVAAESWPPVARAFAAHFLVRLVQPFEGSAGALGAALECVLLAADGFAGDRVLLPEPDVGADHPGPRPDPDAFVRDRAHRLVERLAETGDLVRAESARAAVLSWADERGHGLNARQRRLLRWLAEEGGRTLAFRDYVKLHAGRRAPSLRSLQRDWKGLRDAGLVRETGGAIRVDADALAYGVSPRATRG